MKVLVCGGRDYADAQEMLRALRELVPRFDHLIHGGARGADLLAARIGRMLKMRVTAYRADWERHGKAAGAIRNQRMLDEGKPNLVVAFPGGRGTLDMVRRARAAGLEVREETPNVRPTDPRRME